MNRPRTHTYDPLGRRVETLDSLGAATHVAYDGLNRPAAVTNALGHVTLTAYDPFDNPSPPIVKMCGLTPRLPDAGLERGGQPVSGPVPLNVGDVPRATDVAGKVRLIVVEASEDAPTT